MKFKYLFVLICTIQLSQPIKAQNESIFTEDEKKALQHIDSLYKNGNKEVAKTILKSELNAVDPDTHAKKYLIMAKHMCKYYAGTEDTLIVHFAERKMAIYDSLNIDLPIEKANFLYELAIYYMDQKRQDEAIDIMLEVKDIRIKELGLNHIHLAGVNNNLGSMYMYKGNLDQASLHYKRALEINNNAEKTDKINSDISRNYVNLGIIEKELGNFNKALEYYQNAIDIQELLDDEFTKGIIYYNTAFVYLLTNQHEKAVNYLKLTKGIFIDVLGENHGHVIAVNNLLFQSYSTTGSPLADEYANLLITQSEAVYGPKHPRVALQYSTVARYNTQKGNCEKAKKYINKAININEEIYDDLSFEIANSYNYRLTIASNCGASIDSLQLYFNQTNYVYTNLFGEKSLDITKLINQYIPTLVNQNNLEMADQKVRQAFYSNSTQYDTLSETYIPKQELILNMQSAAETIRLFANVKKLQYRLDSTELIRLHEATDLLSIADSINLKFIQELNTNPETNDLSFNTLVALDLIETEMQLALLEEENAAFSAIEKYKGQNLLQAKNLNKAEQSANVPDSVLLKRSEIILRISDLEQQIYETDSLELHEALVNTRIEEQRMTKYIQEQYPSFYAEKYVQNLATIPSTQDALSQDAALVQYLFDEAKLRFSTIVISNDEVHYFNDTISNDFFSDVTELNKLIKSSSLIRDSKRERFISLSNKIYSTLIQPFEEIIDKKNQLFIIGDGVSYIIPFEVLLESSEDKDFHELNYLINDYEVSYHYSATLMVENLTQEKTGLHGMLAFAPVFQDTSLTEEITSRDMVLDSTIRSKNNEGNFNPLLYSIQEVNAIIEHHKMLNDSANRLLLNQEATEDSLTFELSQPYKFIHLATHSFANEDENQFSGIACSPKGNETDIHNILFANEIYNIDIQADLVVLSSCESGVGKLVTGEGMAGLNRSFLFAGASNVVFSLWKVQDKVTAEFMESFYSNIFSGNSYSQSLRKVKLQMLRNEETACPNFWSSFLLIGR